MSLLQYDVLFLPVVPVHCVLEYTIPVPYTLHVYSSIALLSTRVLGAVPVGTYYGHIQYSVLLCYFCIIFIFYFILLFFIIIFYYYFLYIPGYIFFLFFFNKLKFLK